MELFLFRLVNNLIGKSPVIDVIGTFFASGLIWVMLFALLIVFAARASVREQRHEFATVLIGFFAALGAYVTNVLISLLYFRPRPFVTLADVHLLIAKDAAEKSFPSDHAALAFALAVAVYLAHRKLGAVFLIAAILVGFGRIFVGVHYPSDILVGAVIGGAWGVLVCHFGRRTFEKLIGGH